MHLKNYSKILLVFKIDPFAIDRKTNYSNKRESIYKDTETMFFKKSTLKKFYKTFLTSFNTKTCLYFGKLL